MSTDRPAAAPGARRRVLLVDDDADALELLGEVLRKAGHDVRTVGDAAGALAVVEEFQPAVAVIDIGLPSMNGYELASRIKQRSACRLLALSGFRAAAAPSDTTVTSFDDHFVKPVRISALLSAIERD